MVDTDEEEMVTQDSDENTEETSEDWESDLEKTLQTPDMKKHLKNEKKAEKKRIFEEKKRELNAKATGIVEGQFVKVFNKRALPYSIMFVIGAVVIGLLNLIPSDAPVKFLGKADIINFSQFLIITVSFSMIIGFWLLYVFTRSKKLHELLFSGHFGLSFLVSLFAFGIGFGICVFWWNAVDPTVEGDIDFLTYQQLFGLILALVYFLWNAVQIFYVKTSVEKVAVSAEARFQIKNEQTTVKSRNTKRTILNIVSLVMPFLLHIIFVLLFMFFDTDASPITGVPINRFMPISEDYWGTWYQDWLILNPATTLSPFIVFVTIYFPTVWWANPGFQGMLIWTMAVFVLLIVTTSKQINLAKQSKVNNTRNIFSGIFYMIFWIFLYFKLFSLITTYIDIKYVEVVTTAEPAFIYQVFDWIFGVFLMLITVLNLVRTFGLKVKEKAGKGKSSKITEFNLVLLMFIFVSSYWGGQWSLIASTSKSNLNIATGLIVIAVYIGFYYWYSSWILERRGFIRKNSYTTIETRQMMIELSQLYKDRLLKTIENQEIITSSLNEYMLEKHIILAEGLDEEGKISTLDEAEEEKTPKERLTIAQENFDVASQEKQAYEDAVAELKSTKKKLATLEKELPLAQAAVEKLDDEIEDKFITIDEKKAASTTEITQAKMDLQTFSTAFERLKEPKPPKLKYDREGEEVMEVNDLRRSEFKEAQEEYDGAQKKIGDQQKQIVQLTKKHTPIEKQWTQVNAQLEDSRAKLAHLQETQIHITDNSEKIAALEVDIETLQERMGTAQVLLDAAQIALDSAKQEFQAYEELEEAKNREAAASEKLSQAESVKVKAESDLADAQNQLAALQTQEEIQAEIDVATSEISEMETKKSKTEIHLQETQTSLEEKTDQRNAAKEALNSAKILFRASKDTFEKAEKERAAAETRLNQGEQVESGLKSARGDLKSLKKDQQTHKSIDQSKQDLNQAQDTLKSLKNKLKQVRKQEPVDFAVSEDLTHQIDETDQLIREDKQILRDAKGLQSKVEKLQKTLSQMENEQIDIPEAQETLKAAQEAETASQNVIIEPENAYNDANQHYQDTEMAVDEEKTELKDTQETLKRLQDTFKKTQQTKQNREETLQIRKDTEQNLSEAEKTLHNSEDLFKKAQKNHVHFQQVREEKESRFHVKQETTYLDLEIHKSQAALKESHKVFKQAISKAEQNVIQCEILVKEAQEMKKQVMAERKKS
jgi:hypothetical protein